MTLDRRVPARRTGVILALFSCLALPSWAARPKESSSVLDRKAFFRPDLSISSSHVPLEDLLAELPNRGAWDAFLQHQAGQGAGVRPRVFIEPRSGAVTNLMGVFPLVPGAGVGNALKLADLSRQLGRKVDAVDSRVVADLVLRFVEAHKDVLGIDTRQLGEARANPVTPELWQVSIPQRFAGIPVRDGRLAASISHGNLVTLGVETWGNVRLDSITPAIGSDQALAAGFELAGGRFNTDEILKAPALEVVPVAPPQYQQGEGFVGPTGAGFDHLLVWTFVFQRLGDAGRWEMMVDAQKGEVLALQDTNHYAAQPMTGGVYPLTNTEICPGPTQCGQMQIGFPMPFANTGLGAPNDFTNSAGIFDYTSGTVSTTLSGKYVRISDTCGPISESASGALDLGGVNGQHDCTSAGASAGDTPASRSGFYELNKLIEQARGWLPANPWLQSQLTANMNLNQTCNAFYSTGDGTVNFFKSGGGCRNTGEIAAVFDHEWGHAMDDNDAGGVLSNSSEAYADIAAIYRLQASCVGHGFFQTVDNGCGMTVDGTGFNADEALVGALHCDVDCSGVRDTDWMKHVGATPDTPQNFVCGSCSSGTGPCGRQVHCSAAPVRQAAWDLVARDLVGPPFSLDSQTAFIVANRLFYQGSGNVGSWHACDCAAGTSNGCGAANGYMQWITADDDNGNLTDGTPHMTAIFNAYNRHNIACATPVAVNSGCAAGPSAAPTLTATGGSFSVALTWTAVPGATRYWVFRSEGHAGCDFGKALIAEVVGLAYTDTQVAAGRPYSYNVVAAGASSACSGLASACQTVIPSGGGGAPDFTLLCSPSSLSIAQASSGPTTCTVASAAGFSSPVTLDCNNLPAGVTCGYAPNPVTPPAGASATSALTVSVASTPTGFYNFQARGVSGALTHTFGINLTVTPGAVPNLVVDSTAVDDSAGNNNGVIDFNECVSLNVTLRNSGTAGATGISGTLSTTTPGVAVSPANSTSTYPDIAAGGTGTNASPFRITTSPTFVVGTPIAFTLNVTTGQGPFAINFSVPTGMPGTPVDIIYSGPPVPIPDSNPTGAFAPIPVSGITGSVGKVTATVFINHTWDGDLNLSLIAPDGTAVPLATARGGSGDNFGTNCPADANDTTWDDAAATAIGAGTPPFAGSFRPETPLSALAAKNPNGTWQFKAVDTAAADIGNINCVKLTITPVVGTDGGGACGAVPVGKFYALPPCRVVDTRGTPGPTGGPALGANSLRTFPAAGQCLIPADATAVAMVATVVGETDFGDLRIFPAGTTPIPLASTINFAVNHARANNAIVPLGTAGEISVQCDMPAGSTGTTHFLYDVFGFFK